MYDVEQEYLSLKGTIPWVFTASTPMWDIEYADDTVLMSQDNEVLSLFVSLVVKHARKIGLELNLSKCEHLSVHSEFSITIDHNDQPYVFKKVPFVKYLGIILDFNSSSSRDVRRRLQLCNTSFKLLQPFLRSRSIDQKWRLTVYNQILMSMLTYAMESAALDSSLLHKMDAFHFKVLRCILGAKSTFYNAVVSPDPIQAHLSSNKSVGTRALDCYPNCLTPTQHISQQRMKLFGHLLRHLDSIESRICLYPSAAPRIYNRNLRKGAPRLHWIELAYVEAFKRTSYYTTYQTVPPFSQFDNNFYAPITQDDIKQVFGSSLRNFQVPQHVVRQVSHFTKSQDWKSIVYGAD